MITFSLWIFTSVISIDAITPEYSSFITSRFMLPVIPICCYCLISFIYHFPEPRPEKGLKYILFSPIICFAILIWLYLITNPDTAYRKVSQFGYFQLAYDSFYIRALLLGLATHSMIAVLLVGYLQIRNHHKKKYFNTIYAGLFVLTIASVISAYLPFIGKAAFAPYLYMGIFPCVFLVGYGLIRHYELQISYNNRLVFLILLALICAQSILQFNLLKDTEVAIRNTVLRNSLSSHLSGSLDPGSGYVEPVAKAEIPASLTLQTLSMISDLHFSQLQRGGDFERQRVVYFSYFWFNGKAFKINLSAGSIRSPIHSLFIESALLSITIALCCAILLPFFWKKWLTGPINSLVAGFSQVEQGNYKTQLTTYQSDELGKAMIAFNSMVKNLRKVKVAEKESARIRTELEIASLLQKSMLQHEVDNRLLHVAASKKKPNTLTGDFYGFLEKEDSIAGYLCDVSGSGLSAAHFMLVAHSILKICGNVYHHPELVLGEANRHIFEASIYGFHATAFYFRYDSATHVMQYSSAGHWDQVLFRANGEQVFLNTKGPPLGIGRNPLFQEKSIELFDDDLLFLFTDGVSELLNSDGEMLGLEKAIQFLRPRIHENIDKLGNQFQEMLNAYGDLGLHQDDQTFLLIRPSQYKDYYSGEFIYESSAKDST